MKNTIEITKLLKSGILILALVAMLGQTVAACDPGDALASCESTAAESTASDSPELERLEPIRDLDGDGVVTFLERLQARPGLAGRLAAIRAYLIRIGAFLPVPLRATA